MRLERKLNKSLTLSIQLFFSIYQYLLPSSIIAGLPCQLWVICPCMQHRLAATLGVSLDEPEGIIIDYLNAQPKRTCIPSMVWPECNNTNINHSKTNAPFCTSADTMPWCKALVCRMQKKAACLYMATPILETEAYFILATISMFWNRGVRGYNQFNYIYIFISLAI